MSISPSEGFRAINRPNPVESDSVISRVEGEIPRELNGTLYRNGPNQKISPKAGSQSMHFFDGYRTSHEVKKINPLSNDDLLTLMDDEIVSAHRSRALTPDKPTVRGTAQNPDAFFQMQEARNPYYEQCPQ